MNQENSNSDVSLPGLGRPAGPIWNVTQFFCISRLQESPMSVVMKKGLTDNLDPLEHELCGDAMNALLGVE